MKTFKQFHKNKIILSSANKKDADDIYDITGHKPRENGDPEFILLYDGHCYINAEMIIGKNSQDEPTPIGWKYHLIICRDEWVDTDLSKLERILYDEWYVHECGYWEENKRLIEEKNHEKKNS